MPQKPKSRAIVRGGRIVGYKGTGNKKAEAETAAAKEEDKWAPWKKAWEKESGKKYGIGTHGEFTAWIQKKRKEQAEKKQAGQTAAKQGKALEPNADNTQTGEAPKKKKE